ncbi:MAG: hypothetical protein ABI597_08125 [Gammaproteobacteria bacterium]
MDTRKEEKDLEGSKSKQVAIDSSDSESKQDEIDLKDPGLIPYLLIQKLASERWSKFVRMTVSAGLDPNSRTATADLDTSCANTLGALAIIFLGESNAKELLKRLSQTHIANVGFKSPMTGKQQTYGIANFASKNILHAPDLEQELKSLTANPETVNKIGDMIEPSLGRFTDDRFTSDGKAYFENIEHNFNDSVTTELKAEILANHKTVKEGQTQIYFVVLLTTNDNSSTTYEHVFVIEQFYSSETQEVLHRLYQSWIKQATLLDDFTKRQYGTKTENTYDKSQIIAFLDNFQLYSSTKKTKKATDSTTCFGYVSQSSDKRCTFGQNNSLIGTCVRYFSTTIDPKNCRDNLAVFEKSHPEKSKWQQATATVGKLLAGASFIAAAGASAYVAYGTDAGANPSDPNNSSSPSP